MPSAKTSIGRRFENCERAIIWYPVLSPIIQIHPIEPCIHSKARDNPVPTIRTSETRLRLNQSRKTTTTPIIPTRNELESSSRFISTLGPSPSKTVTTCSSVALSSSSIARYSHSTEHGVNPSSDSRRHCSIVYLIGSVEKANPSRSNPNSGLASIQANVHPLSIMACLSRFSIIQTELAVHLPGPHSLDVIVPSSCRSPPYGPITGLVGSGRNARSTDRYLRNEPLV